MTSIPCLACLLESRGVKIEELRAEIQPEHKCKNMEASYYTPDLSEFHVGFEYERMNGTRWEEAVMAEYCFETYKDGEGYGYENEFEEINKGLRTVRVKHLDRDDCIELGWKYVGSSEFADEFTWSQEKYAKSRFESKVYKFWSFRLQTTEYGVIIDAKADDGELSVSFSGKIQNKSELKKIMQMTGI